MSPSQFEDDVLLYVSYVERKLDRRALAIIVTYNRSGTSMDTDSPLPNLPGATQSERLAAERHVASTRGYQPP